MRFIELFAGVGGFRLGIERASKRADCVFANEWDKYAAQTYNKNFGGKIDTRDITTITGDELPDHDIICGGFPCQAFSIAGKRRGFEETRGTLFFEIMRLAQAKRTKYLFLENVKGLLSHNNGETFLTILESMDELGYDCQWQVLNSKDFGVPQNRERVFIIGHLRTESRPKVFPIRKDDKSSDGGNTKRKGWANTLTGRSAGGQNGRGNYIAEQSNSEQEQAQPNSNDTDRGQTYTSRKPAQWRRTEKGKQYRREAQRSGRDLTPFNDGYRELVPKDSDVIGTITSQAVAKDSLLFEDTRLRRLTPLECERLQGFPDGWTEGVSDTQRYKQMGNAVTVNVIEAIANRLTNMRVEA